MIDETLDNTLRKIARTREEEAAKQLAFDCGLQYEMLEGFPINLDVALMLPVEKVEQFKLIPFVKSSSKFKIAITNPLYAPSLTEFRDLIKANQGLEAELVVVSETSMRYLISTYKKLIIEKKEEIKKQEEVSKNGGNSSIINKIHSIDDLRKELETTNTSDLLEIILAAAYNHGASDIHIEPEAEDVLIRFRIDGVLESEIKIPTRFLHQIVSRIKMLCNMKLDDHASSQDGRFSLADKGIPVDIRTSIIPTGYGEGIVMRLLRKDMQIQSINDLGFSQYNQEIINKIIKKPYGLILVTGPTGSGKSTTLYSILKELNSPEKKIITLEDPIEYRVEGIEQTQIDSEKGFTFAEGLKGILRQDPDIVMVGEIRDEETATIALNASMTGHLVLSTLHTNNAVSVHSRFLEMGIAPYLLSGSIQMIVAQRLVRKPVPGSSLDNPTYSGRIVISEVLVPSQEYEQAVIQRNNPSTLEQIAIKDGMIPMRDDGLDKVKKGLTTEAEISRVTEV